MRSRKTTPEEGLNRGAAAASASPPMAPALQHPQPGRRKATGTKTWLVVSLSGYSYVEEVGKHSIMRRTGLPARDLRVLDPVLSYPSTILGRERAIVVNLEHIKAIVTASEALVLNSTDPMVAPFVQDLQFQISNFRRTPQPVCFIDPFLLWFIFNKDVFVRIKVDDWGFEYLEVAMYNR